MPHRKDRGKKHQLRQKQRNIGNDDRFVLARLQFFVAHWRVLAPTACAASIGKLVVCQ